MSETVLLVEDTPSLQIVYDGILKKSDYGVASAYSADEGARLFAQGRHRVVLLDLLLPDRDGLELMADILHAEPETKVIVITANGSINRAVSAMRGGAFDFLVKPFDEQRLISAVNNAFADLDSSGAELRAHRITSVGFEGFIGTSEPMKNVYEKITRICRSMATVFITGESGTGKEICAESIHNLSNRATGPFVPLDCGAIPSDLLESEVFGHLKGSFPGAIDDKIGAAAAADGGTLFLDEICEMDLGLQTKLLRFLQTSTIQPVGSASQRKVDVRIVCSSNRDPEAEVAAGRLREDLFYRIHVVPVHMPRLRDRSNDAIEIANVMLERFSAEEGKVFTGLSRDVKHVFAAHPWPGNVRQLLNALRNVVVLNDGPIVELSMLAPEFLAALSRVMQNNPKVAQAEPVTSQSVSAAGWQGAIHNLLDAKVTMAEIERYLIEATINRYGDSVPKAARHLDLSPSTIYRKREGWSKTEQ